MKGATTMTGKTTMKNDSDSEKWPVLGRERHSDLQ